MLRHQDFKAEGSFQCRFIRSQNFWNCSPVKMNRSSNNGLTNFLYIRLRYLNICMAAL